VATAQAAPEPAADPAQEAPQILLKMQKVYSGCRSYRDTGEIKSSSVTDGGRFGSDRPFSTAFVRPDNFRFQFTDRGLGERSANYIVWLGDNQVRSWWDAKPGVRKPESLRSALDQAASLSGGVSVRIPGLLMPAKIGREAPLIGATRIDDGTDRNVACIRIKGRQHEVPYTLTMGGMTLQVLEESVTIWLDRGSLLLRRIDETKKFDTYRSETTTTYSPELNVDIAAEQLAFGTPEAK
jgi:hypothetical protein